MPQGWCCRDVSSEPTSSPLDGEDMRYRDGQHRQRGPGDVSARGFWPEDGEPSWTQSFDPMPPCHGGSRLEPTTPKEEQEGKSGAYGEKYFKHVLRAAYTPGIHYVRREGPKDTVLLFKD
ncbi:hypothetical protein GWK47_038345 [Chionoecetes opilio]|uniref:Uncharacterized protein n=1 Tax=Chionoecetes opilio TaxID=41210 RepID=A0A8J4YCP2_CHIOP|nr:hypothetical protein GWK47_038345 [Chionoecetes opilio]